MTLNKGQIPFWPLETQTAVAMSLKKRVDFCEEVQVMPARRTRSRSRGRFKSRRARSQELQGSGKSESTDRKRDRSLVEVVRQGSRNSVRSLVRLFEMKTVGSSVRAGVPAFRY